MTVNISDANFRGILIKLIHIAKRDLGLTDETYQDILYVATKQTSCSKLSIEQLHVVIERLKEKGFRVKAKDGVRNPAQINLILKLWQDLAAAGAINDGSRNALNAYIKRMTAQKNGIGIDSIDWLDSDNASHIVECLKQWNKRIDPK